MIHSLSVGDFENSIHKRNTFVSCFRCGIQVIRVVLESVNCQPDHSVNSLGDDTEFTA